MNPNARRKQSKGHGRIVVNIADFANLSLVRLPAPLRRKLKHALVVASDAVPADVVTMQCAVALLDEASGERLLVRLVYPEEDEAASGRVSVIEPLGADLFGARVGESINVNDANGPRSLRIVEIAYQPEQSMRANVVVRG